MKSNTSLLIPSIFAFTLRAIFPTSSTSFSIRFLIAENQVNDDYKAIMNKILKKRGGGGGKGIGCDGNKNMIQDQLY